MSKLFDESRGGFLRWVLAGLGLGLVFWAADSIVRAAAGEGTVVEQLLQPNGVAVWTRLIAACLLLGFASLASGAYRPGSQPGTAG